MTQIPTFTLATLSRARTARHPSKSRTTALLLAAAVSAALCGCAGIQSPFTSYPPYPEQAKVFTEPPFVRPGVETFVRPASPANVTTAYGPEFASLSGLGAVLVLVANTGRDTPVRVERRTVRLTLPDGSVLRPLEPSEMEAWLQQMHGPSLRTSAKAAISGRHSQAVIELEAKGLLSAPRGKGEGIIVSFRFPQGARSGTFVVDYLLNLGSGEPVAVTQRVALNLRP